MKLNSRKGLTLIEITLVMVLLGFVFSIIGKQMFSGFAKGQGNAAKLLIAKIEQDLGRFYFDCNFFPYTEQGLEALVAAPTGGRTCPNYDPKGYLNKLPQDPWNNKFVYTCEDGLNYEIKSLGADGVPGGEADNADISSKEL